MFPLSCAGLLILRHFESEDRTDVPIIRKICRKPLLEPDTKDGQLVKFVLRDSAVPGMFSALSINAWSFAI